MARSALYDLFLHFAAGNGLIAPGERVLVAVSGGGDSVALLDCLNRYHKCAKLDLFVCHLDHGLRGEESRGDADFVRKLAGSMGLPVEVGRKRVKLIARNRGLSIEAAARAARYEFFVKCARKFGCTSVATAHTLSDNAETILQRIIEGAGPEGLRGIPLVRALGGRGGIRVVRPLLFATRDQVVHYLESRRLTWRLDSSNLDPVYLRNRIRLEVMPALKELNPSVEEALTRVGRSLEDLHDLLSRRVDQAEEALLSCGGGRVEIDRKGLVDLHRSVAAELVKRALLAAGVDGRALSSGHVEALLKLARSRAGSAGVDLPGGLVARREYDRLTITARVGGVGVSGFERELRVPGRVKLPEGEGGGLGVVEAKVLKRFNLAKFIAAKGPTEEVIDADAVRGRLVVRFARRGERFRPLGAPGRRKLQDVLVDAKVPRRLRKTLPLVCDDGGIVWVTGVCIAERGRVTESTRGFLRLRLCSAGGRRLPE